MKNNLRRTFTLFMAMLVLLSSTGFGFIEHACMVRGKSMQLIAKKETGAHATKSASSCCAKSKVVKVGEGTFFKKTDCCKENKKFEKLDVPSQASQLQAKFLKVISDGVIWSATSYTFLQAEWSLPSSQASSRIRSFSSLFYGRSMRSFVQSFLI